MTNFGGINPDGTPNYGAPVPVQGNDPTNIWYSDLPADLQNTPGAKPLTLWYDIRAGSKGKTVTTKTTAPTSFGAGGDVSVLNAQPVTTTSTKTTGRQSSEVHATPADILKQVAALQVNDPQHLMNIQALMSTGVWGSVSVNGVFDTHTENALINAMERYYKITHGTGAAMSFMQYLTSAGTQALTAAQQQKAASAAPPTPPQVSLQDPTTIADVAQSAATQALGETLSQDQIDKFVVQFQAQQRAAQLSKASSATQPDLTAQAMAFAQSSNPGAYQENNRSQYLDTLVNMMGGNRPTASEPVAPVSEAN